MGLPAEPIEALRALDVPAEARTAERGTFPRRRFDVGHRNGTDAAKPIQNEPDSWSGLRHLRPDGVILGVASADQELSELGRWQCALTHQQRRSAFGVGVLNLHAAKPGG